MTIPQRTAPRTAPANVNPPYPDFDRHFVHSNPSKLQNKRLTESKLAWHGVWREGTVFKYRNLTNKLTEHEIAAR